MNWVDLLRLPLPPHIKPGDVGYNINVTLSGPMFPEPGQPSNTLPQVSSGYHGDWQAHIGEGERALQQFGSEQQCGYYCEGISERNGAILPNSGQNSGPNAVRKISLIRITNNTGRSYSAQEAPPDIAVSCEPLQADLVSGTAVNNNSRSGNTDGRSSTVPGPVINSAQQQR